MKYGYRPRFSDHRDLDFHKSFGSAGYDTSTLPNRYSADAGLLMPDQNADGYPDGCTGYAQTDLCTDEDGIIYDAGEFYKSTPPFDDGARDIRESLKLAVNRGPRDKQGNLGPKRTAFYNIRSTGILDWFDAIRVALWITQDEKRSSSIGVPWFREFEEIGADGICPEIVNYSWSNAGGHNAVVSGWTDTNTKGELIRGGEVFLAVKSWQGNSYGDNGWCYWSRPLTNAIFNINYTEAFTLTKMTPGQKQTIDLSIIETLVSYIQNLIRQFGKLWT